MWQRTNGESWISFAAILPVYKGYTCKCFLPYKLQSISLLSSAISEPSEHRSSNFVLLLLVCDGFYHWLLPQLHIDIQQCCVLDSDQVFSLLHCLEWHFELLSADRLGCLFHWPNISSICKIACYSALSKRPTSWKLLVTFSSISDNTLLKHCCYN